eukprot:GHVU01126731.1.p4 GENE.GHVU01126731.1~~GHVU01126731.1.p4  ORF type:complete len:111 (-),score=11.69 GHVU01126731.1:645-977(-)
MGVGFCAHNKPRSSNTRTLARHAIPESWGTTEPAEGSFEAAGDDRRSENCVRAVTGVVPIGKVTDGRSSLSQMSKNSTVPPDVPAKNRVGRAESQAPHVYDPIELKYPAK